VSLTGSALDRAEVCPASCALPAARSTSPYATRGRVLHRFFERLQTVDRDTALADIESEDERLICEAVDLDGLPLDGIATEVTFAFDPATGSARELGRGLERDYSSASATEIVGTIDLVAFDPETRTAYVGDYKTGHRFVTPAAKSRQIHLAAVCAAIVYGAEHVEAEVIRLRDKELPWVSHATFDAFDLGLLGVELAQIRTRVDAVAAALTAGEIPDVSEGEHCRYCPSQHVCPAKVSLALQLGAAAMPLSVSRTVGELTAPVAGEAYHRLVAIEGLCKLVRQQLESLALSRPIPLGDGRYLGPTTSRGRESLDADAVHGRMLVLYGQEIADLAAPSSRAALKKTVATALRHAKEAGLIPTVAPAERALYEDLRLAGGLHRKPARTVPGEYSAAECRTDGCSEQAMSEGGTCDLCALDAEEVARDYSEAAGGGE